MVLRTNLLQPTISGTIPYLGTFMKDLTMTDSALPETVTHPNGTVMINFEKKKKEFEILAQIRILQSSANGYSIQPDPAFLVWFDSIEILREDERYAVRSGTVGKRKLPAGFMQKFPCFNQRKEPIDLPS